MSPTAFITGASQGIGKATALLFAKNGYDLVITARTKDKLEAVAEEIRSLNRQVLAISTDVGNHSALEALINLGLERFSQIDVLVNNAGICMTAPMAKTTIEDWQTIINVNLWGYIHTINLMLPHFLERKQGSIINVGSFGGKVPLPNMTAYCTSKYAVTGLTETLRLELEPQGIHVSGVHPSVTNSDFLERAVFKDSDPEQMKQMLSSPFVSQPEDVAQAIWDAVKYPQAEVIVGSAKVPTFLNRLFPSITQGMLQLGTKTN
ncbi:Short-chain dehydrogenase/reductase SDR [Hyella patelloides LEGE 07179]|uniref:Short-chain dehydrogenase/reductase SDR n=1 Tax=Hyella patelloides LEGE 07179 TaxID=945734 RepID=A0A563VWX0_9CYAN|nr:SDR family oxidoreductase [Hyella patelloides]VEP15911.1 Short-chain dehydrogenase/reductase SDR [Hyella patelloides LEGE 07179]